MAAADIGVDGGTLGRVLEGLTNANCSSSSPFEGPSSLRMAFSVAAVSLKNNRLLNPWLLSVSTHRSRLPDTRRRPRRQPASRPSPTHSVLRVALLVSAHR